MVTNHAVAVPMMMVPKPTPIINKIVVEMYFHKTVLAKCGQMSSLGASANVITAMIGVITKAAKINVPIAQPLNTFLRKYDLMLDEHSPNQRPVSGLLVW